MSVSPQSRKDSQASSSLSKGNTLKRSIRQFFKVPSLFKEFTSGNILLFATLCLLCIGTAMIGSASMPYAARDFHDPMYFLKRQLVYLMLGAIIFVVTRRIPMQTWFKSTFILWLGVWILLAGVLFGHPINGSKRWISLMGFTFQPSEFAKFAMVLFTADYVVRRADEVRFNLSGLLRLLVPMMSILVLTILEPDFGATVVISASMMAVFFLAGAPIAQFIVLLGAFLGSAIMAVLLQPYRLARVLSFTNPWDDIYGTDYQLGQSLIAFGRGEWLGTGFGHSVQKLSYLPEAHTDFMLAIVGEELGFVGICVLFGLLFMLVASIMRIGRRALLLKQLRSGYLAYGIAFIFLLQIAVNGGMNMGLLPTKGLTLPLISYGGTSLLMSLLMVGVVMRIDQELKPGPTIKNQRSI